MMPFISVIVPVYNVERYVRACLDSILAQTFTDFELIVINDGSTDGSGAICDAVAAKDDRVTVIHKENGGQSAARNLGLDRARGEWITFVDSDDWIDSDYYEKLLYEMGKLGPVDVFQSGGTIGEYLDYTERVSAFTNPFRYIPEADYDKIQTLMSRVIIQLYDKDRKMMVPTIGSPCSKIYKREFLIQNGFRFNESLHIGEDLVFNIEAFGRAAAIGGCTILGYHYRQREHEVTVSKGFKDSRLDNLYSMIEELNHCLTRVGCSERLRQACMNYTILQIWNYISLLFANKNSIPLNIRKEVKALKRRPLFADAIADNNNHFFPFNQRIKRYILRLPVIWPVHFLNEVNAIRRKWL